MVDFVVGGGGESPVMFNVSFEANYKSGKTHLLPFILSTLLNRYTSARSKGRSRFLPLPLTYCRSFSHFQSFIVCVSNL